MEKEAKEAAKKLEKEAAKLEKFNRLGKFSKSSEKIGGRSGSLERRRSGEEQAVLNQSTVHGMFPYLLGQKKYFNFKKFLGTASPNRRPTIFDVFRPRVKSDAKKKEKDAAKSSGSSDKDNISSGSNQSGSGGIMQNMKSAMHAAGIITHKPGSTKVNKDGSAHLHAGSDAQVFIQ